LAKTRVQEALRTDGVQMMAWPGELFGGFVKAEIVRWTKVVRDAGIVAQ